MPHEIATIRYPAPMGIDEMMRLAQSIAKSGLFGMKNPDQALALMAIAQAEGRHPAIAARDFHIIQGTAAKKSEAMMRDFLECGGKVEWHALTDTIADATFSHPAGGSVRIAWDMERAKTAGLGGKDNWKKYPRQMLRSRAISEGVRTVCPMATSGMYVPEEVADFDAPQKRRREPIDVTPPKDEPVDLEAGARAAASKGWADLREYMQALPDDDYERLQHLIGTAGAPGELRTIARKADAAWKKNGGEDDPFGLVALAEDAPGVDVPDGMKAEDLYPA